MTENSPITRANRSVPSPPYYSPLIPPIPSGALTRDGDVFRLLPHILGQGAADVIHFMKPPPVLRAFRSNFMINATKEKPASLEPASSRLPYLCLEHVRLEGLAECRCGAQLIVGGKAKRACKDPNNPTSPYARQVWWLRRTLLGMKSLATYRATPIRAPGHGAPTLILPA